MSTPDTAPMLDAFPEVTSLQAGTFSTQNNSEHQDSWGCALGRKGGRPRGIDVHAPYNAFLINQSIHSEQDIGADNFKERLGIQ